jgi:hypothetical protein
VGKAWNLFTGLDRFGALLFFLILAFLLSGAGESGWPTIAGALANLAALVTGFESTGLKRQRKRTIVFAGIGIVGLVLIGVFDEGTAAAGIGALMQAIVLGAILGALVRRVLQHEQVTLATILGVLSAYMLIGLIFAWVYLAMDGLGSGPVLDPSESSLPVYYSFVVLTTLGFGDIVPVDELAQRITALEAITGQIFLATVVARFVSLYGQERPTRSSGES